MFNPDELTKFVQDRLNSSLFNIPDGHKAAIFTYVDQSGIQFGGVIKTEQGWKVEGDIVYHPRLNGLDGGLSLIKTW